MVDAGINELVIKIRSELDTRGFQKAKTAAKDLNKTFSGSLKNVGTERLQTDLKALEAPFQKAQDGFKTFQNGLKGLQGALMGIGFAFLFTGMMVNRYATSIIKSSIKTFNKITTGSEEASGALGILNVHFELLKFAIGGAISALVEAYLPAIIEIVTYMVDWIEQHKELAAKIVVYTAIATAISMAVGAIALFSVGMVGLVEKLLALKAFLGAGGLGGMLSGTVGAIGLSGILLTIGLIIAAVIILWAMWKTNFGNIQEFTNKTFQTIKETFIELFGFIWRTFGNLIDILSGIMEGDWGKVGKALVRIFSDSMLMLYKIASNTTALIGNVFSLMVNVIKDLLINTLLKLPLQIMGSIADKFGLGWISDNVKQLEGLVDTLQSGTTLSYKSGSDVRTDLEKNSWYKGFVDMLESGTKYGLEEKEITKDIIKAKKEESASTWSYTKMITQSLLPSASAFSIKIDEAGNVIVDILNNFGISLETTSQSLDSVAEVLADAGASAAKTLEIMQSMQSDKTPGWTQSAYDMQRALGISSTGAHTYSGLNYGTGAVGKSIMDARGVTASRLATGNQVSYPISYRYAGTTIQNQTNISDGTSSSSAGRYY